MVFGGYEWSRDWEGSVSPPLPTFREAPYHTEDTLKAPRERSFSPMSKLTSLFSVRTMIGDYIIPLRNRLESGDGKRHAVKFWGVEDIPTIPRTYDPGAVGVDGTEGQPRGHKGATTHILLTPKVFTLSIHNFRQSQFFKEPIPLTAILTRRRIHPQPTRLPHL